jgi:2-polyprenyl-6-methoxyphenol hydroxylase-like FAD-dependent oxidoreductase
MTENFDADVLICGSGAAGLTLAIDLARRGVSFCLIDKMDDPFGGSRGKGIQPRSQEIFEDLGVLDRIVAVGGVYPRNGSIETMAATRIPSSWSLKRRHRPSLITSPCWCHNFARKASCVGDWPNSGIGLALGGSCRVLSRTTRA